MGYTLSTAERERRIEADRNSSKTSQSDTVWVSMRGRQASCYHQSPDCKQAQSANELRERRRSDAQQNRLAPCRECSPSSSPALSREPGDQRDLSINNALKAADSIDDLLGGDE